LAGEKILIVDDEPQVRKLLETFLDRSGFVVRVANDGLEALTLLREEIPDLVITDVTMPNLNGLELTHRLRASHRTSRIPILMLSALKQESDVLAGYAQGADDYIGKPIELTILRAKVDQLLRRSSGTAVKPVTELGQVIAFMHGKGGVGTTTLAVNTAVAMIDRSPDRVALLDLNLTFSNSYVLLNVRDITPLTRLAALHGDVDDETFARFVIRHASGLRLVVGNHVPEESELVSVPAVQLALDKLRRDFDYVVVDLPVNFSEHTLAVLDSARIVCLVTTPRLAAMKATRDCLDVLNKISYPPEQVRLVVNQTSPSGGLGVDTVMSFFKREPIAVVRYDDLFDAANDAGKPLVTSDPGGSAAADVQALARRIEDSVYEGPKA
jgi:pilus assembly protein CpaE